MIKDITLGQYFPGSSVVHNLDARFKLVIIMSLTWLPKVIYTQFRT